MNATRTVDATGVAAPAEARCPFAPGHDASVNATTRATAAEAGVATRSAETDAAFHEAIRDLQPTRVLIGLAVPDVGGVSVMSRPTDQRSCHRIGIAALEWRPSRDAGLP